PAAVAGGKAGMRSLAVLPGAARQIRRHPGVQRPVAPVRHDVDGRLPHVTPFRRRFPPHIATVQASWRPPTVIPLPVIATARQCAGPPSPSRHCDREAGPKREARPPVSPSLRPRGRAEAGSNPEASPPALDRFVGLRLLALTMNVPGRPPPPVIATARQ